LGNSTVSLQNVLDYAAAKGIPVPTQGASGYGTDLALKIANDVMGDLIAERFNWKWNRATAAPFYTNSWQQDYPQIGITDIGWGEDCDRMDINNTSFPKPLNPPPYGAPTWRRQLSRSSMGQGPPAREICWMYNKELSYGVWPGPGITFSPLVVTAPAIVKQNPIMSMIDSNGNLLIVTGFGVTGLTAPVLPVNSVEGVPVTDGTVTWKVVGPMSQGFRVLPLAGAAGPVWQITPYYQMRALAITALGQLLNPIPDDYSRFFQNGYEAYCFMASPNPGDKERGEKALGMWMKSMMDIKKQGDREADAYAMLPATSPVENVYGWTRNPQDPGQPY
jgi:hypothetical protein